MDLWTGCLCGERGGVERAQLCSTLDMGRSGSGECGCKLPSYHFSIGCKLSYNSQAKELSLCFLKVFSVEFKLLSPLNL